MNEKLFNSVGPKMGKVCELVSLITLVGCEHVTVDVTSEGVGITAYPRDVETKDKVMGLMRMYARKDDELQEEPHKGEYHNWFTCQLIFNFEKD